MEDAGLVTEIIADPGIDPVCMPRLRQDRYLNVLVQVVVCLSEGGIGPAPAPGEGTSESPLVAPYPGCQQLGTVDLLGGPVGTEAAEGAGFNAAPKQHWVGTVLQ
eukprot:694297-Lingulodinium_polyedra.AAC.1